MLAENVESIPMSESSQRASFFRQSGWLMIANIAGGVLMWGVHFLAKRIGATQYGIFITLLTAVMLVPAIPLQMVFAQQTAKALARGTERELAGLIRFVCLGLFVIWLVVCITVLLCQNSILKFWEMSDAGPLWATMPILLLTLWAPVFMGVLQGQQNFLWLGWSMMANGIGRLGGAVVVVLLLRSGALGMMLGVLLGTAVALGIAIWQARGLWTN